MGPETNTAAMEEAMESVTTMEITYAARTTTFDGQEIREGPAARSSAWVRIFSIFASSKVPYFWASLRASTEDILKEIKKTPAEVVYVLPNNKNIIMAAQQCVGLVEGNTVLQPLLHSVQIVGGLDMLAGGQILGR